MRDRLAEDFSVAPPDSVQRREACRVLADHIRETIGMPFLGGFSTVSGKEFVVHVSTPKNLPEGVEKWLAGRDFVKVVKELLAKGSSLPTDVMSCVRLTVSEKK